jgi:hypothetical protein
MWILLLPCGRSGPESNLLGHSGCFLADALAKLFEYDMIDTFSNDLI